MARHPAPPPCRLRSAESKAYLILLSVALVAGVLDRALSAGFGSRGGVNAPGMTAVSSAQSSGARTTGAASRGASVSATTAATRARGADAADAIFAAHAAASMEGTYLPEVIAEGGQKLKRWVDRVDDPIRVWIAPGDSVLGFRPTFVGSVNAAFFAWEQTGVPVRFALVDSADDAEVRVEWAERLPERRAGLAHWWTKGDGWLTKANLVLATQLSDDGRADETTIYRMALHEIGHLLGLEHSADTGDIMSSWVNANALTARDRATVRLLYSLPPGAVPTEAGATGS